MLKKMSSLKDKHESQAQKVDVVESEVKEVKIKKVITK